MASKSLRKQFPCKQTAENPLQPAALDFQSQASARRSLGLSQQIAELFYPKFRLWEQFVEAEPEFGAVGRGIVPGDQAVQEKGRKEGSKENNDKITPGCGTGRFVQNFQGLNHYHQFLLDAKAAQVVHGAVVDVEVHFLADAGEAAAVGVLPELPGAFVGE